MSLQRKYWISSNYFRFPQGSSPTDDDNVALVKRIIKASTGAKNVDVDFAENGNGQPLIDQMQITVDYPETIMGKYVSLAAIQGEQGNILAELIKAMSSGGDAKGTAQRLLDSLNTAAPEEGLEKEGPPKPTDGAPPGLGPKPPTPPAGGGGLPGKPATDKPRMPFAKREGRLKRAMVLESKAGIPLNAALEAVTICDKTANFAEALPKLKEIFRDAETDQDLPLKDYVDIAKMARGNTVPLDQ